ncbi:MAG: hypothetical protein ACJ73S_07940 [Mycobacteriales bacterium]
MAIADRPDLRALTPDGLAALANRGLVKRAARELDAGTGPAVEVAPDGTVHGRYPDGPRCTLPPGAGLDHGGCDCGAPGVCRHLIGLVLAYQQTAPPVTFTPWSPGDIDDTTLTAHLGARTVAAAGRMHRAGYPVRIRRPTPADPIATAELPSCTVRFLVPGELGYVDTDAGTAARAELVALAVWAFREADTLGLPGDDIRFDVGGDSHPGAGVGPAALAAVDLVLCSGAVHSGPVLPATVRRAARDLERRGLRWPAAAMAELADQLDAYHHRAAGYDPARLAELAAEIHARHRAATAPAVASPRSRVLGTEEAAETPLRRARLVGLGCRRHGNTAEVYLAHAGTGDVFVLRRGWPSTTGSPLADRRVGGVTLAALATGNVVSESAVRSASRQLRLASSRVAKTTVAPLGDAWATLPAPLTVQDFKTLAADLATLPPRLIRPRIEAEMIRVLAIAEVLDIGYHPGDQRLEATIADKAGTTATVSADYNPAAPGSLEALAEALSNKPRYLAGSVRLTRGTILTDPLAILTGTTPTVPDLSPGDGATPLSAATPTDSPDPLHQALQTALSTLTQAAHHGLDHPTPTLQTRLTRAAQPLTALGLTVAATHLTTLANNPTPTAWLTAYLHLHTATTLR